MDETLREIVFRWRLGRDDRRHLISANASTRGSITVAEECLDIDRALVGLLGDRHIARRWLRRPHAAFYHVTPLQMALGSPAGRKRLRLLLEEAAYRGDADAAAVLAAEES